MSDDRETQLLDKIAALEAENRFLREKIDLLVRRVFGSSSEQMNKAQLELEGLLAEGKADAPALVENEMAGAGCHSCLRRGSNRRLESKLCPGRRNPDPLS